MPNCPKFHIFILNMIIIFFMNNTNILRILVLLLLSFDTVGIFVEEITVIDVLIIDTHVRTLGVLSAPFDSSLTEFESVLTSNWDPWWFFMKRISFCSALHLYHTADRSLRLESESMLYNLTFIILFVLEQKFSVFHFQSFDIFK